MDVQRYLLIGAIALIAFVLLNEWEQFKREHTPEPAVSSFDEPAPQTDTATRQSSGGDGDSVPQTSPGGDTQDIPTAAAPSAGDIPTTATETASNGRHTVAVSTDVLQVKIDKRGGDVVFAALPQHQQTIDATDKPFVILERNPVGITYIAQSGLIGGPDTPGTDSSEQRPLFSSSDDRYQLSGESLSVDLVHTTDSGVTITKRFTFRRGDYLIDVTYLIDNGSDSNWLAQFYAQLKRDDSPDPGTDDGRFGIQAFLGVATRSDEDPYIKRSLDDLEEDPLSVKTQQGWIAMVQHYFISAWIPDADQPYQYQGKVSRSGFNLARVLGKTVNLQPGQSGQIDAGLYVGPKDQYRLEEIAPGLDLTVDYGFLWWLAQPLFWLLNLIHGFVGNWGWAIIILTIIVKGAFFQLNATAYKSMANLRRVQPKFEEIKERYADDKQKQSQEMMKLYQKEKINPLGGCLPILVQMPVFLALYWVLLESVELRHAPWALWIKDLSAMDHTFVLPLIMGATMWFQQKLNPPPPDPMQAKVMQWMPVMFTIFFLWFPSGLVLYYVVNNALSILQQYIITKKIVKDF